MTAPATDHGRWYIFKHFFADRQEIDYWLRHTSFIEDYCLLQAGAYEEGAGDFRHSMVIMFRNELDAVLFKMRWC